MRRFRSTWYSPTSNWRRWFAWGRKPRRTWTRSPASVTPASRSTLKPEPYINRCRCGMDFLGCRVYPSHRTLNRRGRVRFQRSLRRLQGEYSRGNLGALELQCRAMALVAFTRADPTASWRWRDRVLRFLRVDDQGLASGHPGR